MLYILGISEDGCRDVLILEAEICYVMFSILYLKLTHESSLSKINKYQ